MSKFIFFKSPARPQSITDGRRFFLAMPNQSTHDQFRDSPKSKGPQLICGFEMGRVRPWYRVMQMSEKIAQGGKKIGLDNVDSLMQKLRAIGFKGLAPQMAHVFAVHGKADSLTVRFRKLQDIPPSFLYLRNCQFLFIADDS